MYASIQRKLSYNSYITIRKIINAQNETVVKLSVGSEETQFNSLVQDAVISIALYDFKTAGEISIR